MPNLAAAMIAIAIILSGCNGAETPEVTDVSYQPDDITYQQISAEQAYEMMNELDDFILLDVRTQAEFNDTGLYGAILIPVDELQNRAESELPDKDAVILIYCRSGQRSAIAAQMLVHMGYTNVYDFGGIINWPFEL